ncbi:MAG: Fe-S cluster assembly sulfur transfer protein SufU [Verrucomicrobiales bacterium]
MEMDELYQDILLDHAKKPRNQAALSAVHGKGFGDNPSCGDEVEVEVQIDPASPARLVGLRFQSQACAICTASASIMSTLVKDKALVEVQQLKTDFLQSMTSDRPPICDSLEIETLMGVRKFPQRVKCATLAWHALDDALKQSQEMQELKA